MMIERLDLMAFGRFTDHSLDLSAGPHRFHIIYGPNESGKSTSLRAISDWLFGFKSLAVDDYVHRMNQLRVGGRIVSGDKVVECLRRKGNKDTLLQMDNKTKAESDLLDDILGDLDRETFEQQFGISHQQLVEGGRMILDGKGDLGEILFSAGAGLSRLNRIRDQLKERRAKIYTDRKSNTPSLYQAINQWDVVRASLRDAATPLASYHKAVDRLADAQAKEQAIATKLKASSIKRERLSAINRSTALFVERRSLQEKLQRVADSVVLSPSFGFTYRDLCSKRIHAEQRSTQVLNELEKLRAQIDSLAVDKVWLDHEAAIESLNQSLRNFESQIAAKAVKGSTLQQTQTQIDQLRMRMSAGVAPIDFDGTGISLSVRAQIVSLASQYSGVVESLSNAEVELTRRRDTFRKGEQNAKTRTKPVSPQVLDNAVRSVGNPQSLLAAQSRAKDAFADARDAVNEALNRLSGFSGSVEQAVALQLPPADQLTQTAADIEQSQKTIRELEAESLRLDSQIASIRSRIDIAESAQALPDPERLIALQAERDRLLMTLIDLSSEQNVYPTKDAVALRDRVLELDRIHELRHRHHDLVLRRESDDREIRQLEHHRAEHQTELDREKFELDRSLQRWKALWATIEVDAGSVESMRTWCDHHKQLLRAAGQWKERTSEFNQANEALERAAETLRDALRVSRQVAVPVAASVPLAHESSLFDGLHDDDELDGQSLSALYSLALREREELAAQMQSHDLLVSQLTKAQEDYEVAESQYQSAVKKRDNWDDRWSKAIEPLRALGGVTPESIDAMLRAVDELASLKRLAAELESEQKTLSESTDQFLRSLQDISGQCFGDASVEVDASRAAEMVNKLVSSLRKALSDQQRRAALQEQRESLDKETAEAANRIATIDRELQLLCTEAGCESVDGLADCERASDDKRQWLQSLEAVENHLLVYAGNIALDAFELEAAAYEPGAIESEISSLDFILERLEAERTAAHQEIGAAQAEVEKMDGSDRAALLLQEKQNLLARIRREAEQYAKLTVAQDVLSKAIDHYRSQNQGAVLARAADCFSRMTQGQYSTLKVDFDSEDQAVLYAVRSDGTTLVPANRLSDGTADALYLSMRIASLEVHLRSHRHIPLIVDDCLIQFDDRRAAAAIGVLSELSTQTQVILFTHHAHLVDLTKATLKVGQYHLHELELPK